MSIQSASAGSFRSSSPQRSIRFGHLADVKSRSVSSAFLRTPSGMSLRRGQTPAKASQNASIATSLPYKGPFDQLTVLWFRISHAMVLVCFVPCDAVLGSRTVGLQFGLQTDVCLRQPKRTKFT